MGQHFSLKLFKNKPALSKTNRDGTRQIGGARAWWVVEQFRAASSVLFHFSKLTFLFVVHARNRHDLRSHVVVGNTTLRRRPCIGSWHDWTDLVLRAHGEAHLRPHARGEFDRSGWSSTSMITDRSPDDVFQLRKSKTTTKRRLAITEAFVSETILFTCGNSACKRGAFAPPPWMCVSRSSQSRAEHRKSISLWASATYLVPVPAATSRSVVFLSDAPSAPDHEAVLQVEEGVMSAVVEMRCNAACKYIGKAGLWTRKRTGS